MSEVATVETNTVPEPDPLVLQASSQLVLDDLYSHVVNRPSGGNARVKSEKMTIFNRPGDESFYAAADTYLVETIWDQKASWHNDTTVNQRLAYEYVTELRITEGSEVTVSLGISASFKGLGVDMSGQRKVFSQTETTETSKKIVDLTIPAESTLFFYQRRYRFKITMFFILDAWAQLWNVGSWGGYEITRKEVWVDIMSEDYATKKAPLDSATYGTFSSPSVPRAFAEYNQTTRKRENITQRAKDALVKIGA